MPTPFETVSALAQALNVGDLDAALSHYEPQGVLVAEPGSVAQGAPAVREALAAMLTSRPTLTTGAHEVLIAQDIAMIHTHWSMAATAPDGSAISLTGQSSDVLRRQPDGGWKIAIDNPWGTAVLSPAPPQSAPAP